MNVEITSAGPAEIEADTLALVAGGLLVRKLDALFEGRLARSAADGDPIAIVHVGRELRARRILLVATDGLDPEDVRTAVARAVRATRGTGSLAWAIDDTLPMNEERQLQAVVEGAPGTPPLGLVGKAVTFDAGGYFLKPQSDIVRQKGDMAGGAAVLAAMGAIAELEVPVRVTGVLAACENMVGPDAIRP